MALLYATDGSAEEVCPADGKSLTLDEFHRLLPSAEILDFVYLLDRTALVIDDLGQRKGLPVNKTATRLYSASGGQTPIHGPALHCRLDRPGMADERWT